MVVCNFISRVVIFLAEKLGGTKDVWAVTIWPFIFVWPDSHAKDPVLINHEKKHIEQWKRYWIIGFLPVYLWHHFKKGYWDNPLEIEAREAEKRRDLLEGQ